VCAIWRWSQWFTCNVNSRILQHWSQPAHSCIFKKVLGCCFASLGSWFATFQYLHVVSIFCETFNHRRCITSRKNETLYVSHIQYSILYNTQGTRYSVITRHNSTNWLKCNNRRNKFCKIRLFVSDVLWAHLDYNGFHYMALYKNGVISELVQAGLLRHTC